MKKLILFGLGLSLLSTVNAQGNATEPQWLENIIVEKYYVSTAADAAKSDGPLPVGSVTYRVYADMLPGAKLLYLYGEPQKGALSYDHPLIIKTSTNFFNQETDGAITPSYNKTTAINNTLMLDSWFSFGPTCQGYWGVTKTEDDSTENIAAQNKDGILKNIDAALGIPLTKQDGMISTKTGETFQALDIAPGLDLSIFDASQKGGIFNSTEASIGVVLGVSGPTGTNKVLIGQFTTDGKFEFELNLAIKTPSGHTVRYTATPDYFSAESTPLYDLQAYLPFLKYPSATDANNLPPTVKIAKPAKYSKYTYTDNVNIEVEANDVDGQVKNVYLADFDGNEIKSATETSNPYKITIDAGSLGVGYYNLTAVAVDDKGNKSTSAPVVILISNDAKTKPYVTISSPPHFSQHPRNVAIPIIAEAYDADTTLKLVEFYKKDAAGNYVSIGKDSIGPEYSVDYTETSPTDTSAIFSAKVTDNRGTTGDYAGHILLFSSNTAPLVAVTIPKDTTKINNGTDTTITVTASDNEKVALVEFYLDGIKIGEDGLAPFQLMWKAGPIGMHEVKAIATDNKGLKTTSAVVKFEVVKGTGIEIYTADKPGIKMYPNPVQDELTFEFNSGKTGNYYLYNTSGQLLQSGKLVNGAGKSTEKIKMTDYSSGNYILELIIDGQQSSGIVIKQ